jgi:EmrB/QacA subfamily drug resistance transporter
VTFAGFLLLGGRAADLLGRRRVFVSGLVLFALASLAGGLADSQGVLIAARAIQGLGAAVIAPASLSILTTTFTETATRNRAVAIWGAMGGAGGAAGSLLGGIITQSLSWRWILFINVPIGLGVALLTYRFVAEGRSETGTRNFDLAGALTATIGLSLLVLGIVRTSVTGWGSGQTLGLMAGGLGLLAAFVTIEGWFAKAPLMPLRIFSTRTLSVANVVIVLTGAASFAMWFFVTLYLQLVLHYSPIETGFTFLPMALLIAACATIAPRLVPRVGAGAVLTAGMLFQAAGLALFTQVSVGGEYVSDVLAPSLLVAIGIGFAFVSGTISAVAGVEPQEAGLASGLVNTSRMFGGALGLAILAAIATSRTGSDVKHGHSMVVALTSGFQAAFGVAAGFALIGAIVAALGLPRFVRRPARVVDETAAAPVEVS